VTFIYLVARVAIFATLPSDFCVCLLYGKLVFAVKQKVQLKFNSKTTNTHKTWQILER